MILVAVGIATVVSLLATAIWTLIGILFGAIGNQVVAGQLMFVACGLLCTIFFAYAQKNRWNIGTFHTLLCASILTGATIIITFFNAQALNISYSGAGITIIIFGVSFVTLHTIRGMFAKLSLQRGEEFSQLLVRLMRVCGLVFFCTIVIIPFYFMIFSSITPRSLYLQDTVRLLPRFQIGFKNIVDGYVEVMTTFKFGRYIVNSLFVSLSTVILTLIPSTLGAYAVTRLRFKGRDFIARSILLIYMFPTIVLAIPLYSVFATLGLRDTLFGLLIVYPAITIPVSLYMLRNYFQTLPADIEEAGIIDGLSRVGVIWRITIPLSVPAIMAVGLYIFMIAWNEFLFAFMFLDKQSIFTLSRGVVSLNSQEVPRQYLMAGSILITVPVIVLFFSFERFLTGGLSAGGVKE